MKRGLLFLILMCPLQSHAQNPFEAFRQMIDKASKDAQQNNQTQSQNPAPPAAPSPPVQIPAGVRPIAAAAVQRLETSRQKVLDIDPENTSENELNSVGTDLINLPENISEDVDFSVAARNFADQYKRNRTAYLTLLFDRYLAYISTKIRTLPDTPTLADEERVNAVKKMLTGWAQNYMRYLHMSSIGGPSDGPVSDRWKIARDSLEQKSKKILAIKSQGEEAREQQQSDAVTKAHAQDVAKLGFSKNFLQATIYLNTMGQNGKYRRFDEWLAMVFANPTVKLVTQVNIDKGKSRGVTIKQEGQPSLTFLFSLDGDELYLTHMGNNQQAVSVTTSPNVMNRASMEVMRMAREGPYANVNQ